MPSNRSLAWDRAEAAHCSRLRRILSSRDISLKRIELATLHREWVIAQMTG